MPCRPNNPETWMPLRGTFAPAAQEGPGDTNEPIEVTSRLVRETPQGSAEGWRTAVRRPGAAAWTTPGPTLLTRGVQLPPGTKAGKVACVSIPEGGRFIERSYTNSAGTAPTNCTSRVATPG